MSLKRILLILLVASIMIIVITPYFSVAEVQGNQLRLFSTTATADVGSASFRFWHNGTDLPGNWKSPIDWSTGPVYWRIRVTSKKTAQPLRMTLVMEKEWPDGRVGMEEISDLIHKAEVTQNGQTVYVKLDPLAQWNLNSSWQAWAWDKPINGIYSFVWAWDETKNDWVWFAGPSVCDGYDFCYKGTLKQADHLPMTIQSEAFITQAGKPFVPPSSWAGCPWPECANIPTGQPTSPPQNSPVPTNKPPTGTQPTTNPSKIPSILPTSIPGECINHHLGDANCDDAIGLVDYNYWRREFRGELTSKKSDFNNDTRITLADYQIWRRTFTSK